MAPICIKIATLLILTNLCVNCVNSGDDDSKVTLEALYPTGFRVSLPADPGVKLFAFHANINQPISELEPGEISVDITNPKNGSFTYYDPDMLLEYGDIFYYWIFVRNGDGGYRKDGLNWTITELTGVENYTRMECLKNSRSIAILKKPETAETLPFCKGDTMLHYIFNSTVIDEEQWTVEQYIADKPAYEFVVYKKDPDVVFLADEILHIRPKLSNSKEELTTLLNVSHGCTKVLPHECIRSFGGIYQPPITSARLVSKSLFTFGEVEIMAKLPVGDWLYSDIYLEDITQPKNRIIIAHAVGNRMLKTAGNDEIGNKIIRGGILESKSSYMAQQEVGDGMHIYKIRWHNDSIFLHFDNLVYGSVHQKTIRTSEFADPNLMRLVIEVAAGGIMAFPDDCVSGNYTKPWKNRHRDMVKQFFNSRSKWLTTWNPEISQLQIEYIKIIAI